MEGTELRRSMTLSEQLAVEDSPNPPTAPTGVAEKREAFAAESGPGSVSHWNLMDIIKEEHDVNGGAGAGINWKSLKERLRLHRTGAGAVWATPSGHPCPISDPEVVVSVRPNPAAALGRSISRSVSIRNAEITFRGSASRRGAIVSDYNPPAAAAARGTAEEEESDSPASGGSRGGEKELEGRKGSNRSGAGEAEAAAEEQPVTISLMALLEQTDRWGGEGEEAAAAEEEEVAEDDDDGEGDVGGMYYVCCVCMVRHKGAAFIPCGHTFCRLCSRELWVSRGNCPLCNGFIFEILDIF